MLGRTIDEVLELPERELLRWHRYWEAEPWGPYRDNLHAAMIVTELLKPHLKKGVKLNLSDYLLVSAEERRQKDTRDAARQLSVLAAQGTRR